MRDGPTTSRPPVGLDPPEHCAGPPEDGKVERADVGVQKDSLRQLVSVALGVELVMQQLLQAVDHIRVMKRVPSSGTERPPPRPRARPDLRRGQSHCWMPRKRNWPT